jgi:hypothetical protein
MAHHARWHDEWKSSAFRCESCDWTGRGDALSRGEMYESLMEFDCPSCFTRLLLVSFPTLEESRANRDKLGSEERRQVEAIEDFRAQFEREKLKGVDDLPDVSELSFVFHWDFSPDDADARTLIRLGDRIIFNEPALYEGGGRFEEVAKILKAKYGSRLKDLVPTEESEMYLYGDNTPPGAIDAIRRRLFS